ncbi:hypothetical protein [Metabacillus indicus]|uniref:hypothetical protein n=1 Tax=Metabacillus indicus TaxID=246786 RepID=UPI0004938E99|nr:hypothetical protein [Metabacillus indicus]KEZ50885.1 hypothetical protein AZ46_0209630 [Metabacillus indicus LMG 22858]
MKIKEFKAYIWTGSESKLPDPFCFAWSSTNAGCSKAWIVSGWSQGIPEIQQQVKIESKYFFETVVEGEPSLHFIFYGI